MYKTCKAFPLTRYSLFMALLRAIPILAVLTLAIGASHAAFGFSVIVSASPKDPQTLCPYGTVNVKFTATVKGAPKSTSECTIKQGNWEFIYLLGIIDPSKRTNPATFTLQAFDTPGIQFADVLATPKFYYVPKNPGYTGCPTINNFRSEEYRYRLDVLAAESGEWSQGVNVTYTPPAVIQNTISKVFSKLTGGNVDVKVSANFKKQSRDCCYNEKFKKNGVVRDKGSLSATVDLANIPVVIEGIPLSVTKAFGINERPYFAVKGSVKAGIFFTADTTLTGSGSRTSSECTTPADCFTGDVGLSDTLGITGTAKVIACVAILGGQAHCGKVKVDAKADASVAGDISDTTCGKGLAVDASLEAADASVSATLGGFTDTVTIYHLDHSVPLFP